VSAATIAVIGGTGMNQWPGLEIQRHHALDTPYGAPSAPLIEGRFHGTRVLFLPRHGVGHVLPPHAINYRANVAALKAAGVTTVIAVAAVGGIAHWFAPGEVCVPNDLVDYTWGRAHSFADGAPGSTLQHVEFSEPYTARVRTQLIHAGGAAGIVVGELGIMAVTQGPRLESPAEIRRLQRDGCDMVGMTGMPEAALAREAGLEYAALAVCVNWAAGVKGIGDIHAEIHQSIERGMEKVRAVLAQALPRLG
jgi:5'-methylthioinosine phosphorylase